MSVKTVVCNLGLSRLGNFGSVENIDTPKKTLEIVCAKWWDAARRMALKQLIPNFALDRRILAPDATAPAFGYSKRFEYPSDCVRVLGFGEIQAKDNNHSIEGSWILTDTYDEDTTTDPSSISLNLRFVKDEADVSKWTPEFIDAFSWFFAYCVNMEVTQDMEKQVYLEKIIGSKQAQASAMTSQENMPIRINRSKFKAARRNYNPVNYDKK